MDSFGPPEHVSKFQFTDSSNWMIITVFFKMQPGAILVYIPSVVRNRWPIYNFRVESQKKLNNSNGIVDNLIVFAFDIGVFGQPLQIIFL